MIDKKIYYCWFGKGEKSNLNKMCMESWKQFCPDYEIIEINENNFDCYLTPYSTEGYKKGNWSAVSNTARFEVLHNESGFYLDTDVQLVKSLDELRIYDKGFITEFIPGQPDAGVLGRGSVNSTIFENAREQLTPGSVTHKILLRNLYQMYDIHGEDIHTYDDGFTILSEQYIPSVKARFRTDKTIAIHHYENSWIDHPINILDKSYPFQRVQVMFDNKMIYKDKDPVVRLHINNRRLSWRCMGILGKLNYFFNKNVIKIEAKEFLAERIDYNNDKPLNKSVTPSGLAVYYIS